MILKPYVVRQGDTLTTLSLQRGFDANEVWNHEKNAELKALRGDMDVLYPSDLLFLPDKPASTVPIKAGAANAFKITLPTITLRIAFADEEGPYAGEEFVVEGIALPVEGTTDGDGVATFAIPHNTKKPIVTFPKRRESFVVQIGHLDPVTTASGVRQRLTQLGYLGAPMPVTEANRAKALAAYELEQAIRAFQRAEDLVETGTADQPTREALVEIFGS